MVRDVEAINWPFKGYLFFVETVQDTRESSIQQRMCQTDWVALSFFVHRTKTPLMGVAVAKNALWARYP